MDGVVFLIRAYWLQAVGFVLTVLGTSLVLASTSFTSDSQALGTLLAVSGWLACVFDFPMWLSRGSTAKKTEYRVSLPGLCVFVLACCLSLVIRVYWQGWNEYSTLFCVAVGLVVLISAKDIWDKRTKTRD